MVDASCFVDDGVVVSLCTPGGSVVGKFTSFAGQGVDVPSLAGEDNGTGCYHAWSVSMVSA